VLWFAACCVSRGSINCQSTLELRTCCDARHCLRRPRCLPVLYFGSHGLDSFWSESACCLCRGSGLTSQISLNFSPSCSRRFSFYFSYCWLRPFFRGPR